MRPLLVILLAAGAAFSQSLSFGLKVGAAATDLARPIVGAQGNVSPGSGRSVIGPTAELRLPFHLAVEFDALRRPLEYRFRGPADGPAPAFDLHTTGTQWEFPVLAKYRAGGSYVSPFVTLGVAWNRVSLKQTGTATGPFGVIRRADTDNPPELVRRSVSGIVAGAGLEGHLPVVRISGELRFTRWRDDNVAMPGSNTGISRRSQLEALVGITF